MITIATVVEGFGEVRAVPVLVRRIAQSQGIYGVQVPEPFRLPRAKLTSGEELGRACAIAATRVKGQGCVLLIADADDDCAVVLANQVRTAVPKLNIPLHVVIANREFESVFLAASASLVASGHFTARHDGADPESIRGAKEVVRRLMCGPAYREAGHQVRLCARMSLTEARGCRWYRKLEADLAAVLAG